MKQLLKRRGICRRYGAVDRWQSVAVIDRFFGALKSEYATRWIPLLPMGRINEALERYSLWHGRYRPHQRLDGRTPNEFFFHRRRRQVPERLIRDIRTVNVQGVSRLPVYRRVLAA